MKKNLVVLLKGILLGLISMGIPGLSASTIGIIIGILSSPFINLITL